MTPGNISKEYLVVHILEFPDISVLLHKLEEFYDHLGGRTDHDLSLASPFCIEQRIAAVAQNADENHGVGKFRVLAAESK